jgi:hypothetical protein
VLQPVATLCAFRCCPAQRAGLTAAALPLLLLLQPAWQQEVGKYRQYQAAQDSNTRPVTAALLLPLMMA